MEQKKNQNTGSNERVTAVKGSDYSFKTTMRVSLEEFMNGSYGQVFTNQQYSIGDVHFYCQCRLKDSNSTDHYISFHCNLLETQNISKICVSFQYPIVLHKPRVSIAEGLTNHQRKHLRDNGYTVSEIEAISNLYEVEPPPQANAEGCEYEFLTVEYPSNATKEISFDIDKIDISVQIKEIYDRKNQKIPKRQWKQHIFDSTQSSKTKYFQYQPFVISSFIRLNINTSLFVPDEIGFIIFDYMNDFKHCLSFIHRSKSKYDQLCKMDISQFVTSKIYKYGDLNFNIRFHPKGGVKEDYIGIYLEMWSMALAQRVSAIKVYFVLKSKELHIYNDREYCFEMPYDGDTSIGDDSIGIHRLLFLKNKGLSIECHLQIIEIFDLQKKSVERKYWNSYLNFGKKNFAQITNQKRLVKLQNLKDISLNGRIGEVIDYKCPYFKNYHYFVRILTNECSEKVKDSKDDDTLLIFDKVVRLRRQKVIDFDGERKEENRKKNNISITSLDGLRHSHFV